MKVINIPLPILEYTSDILELNIEITTSDNRNLVNKLKLSSKYSDNDLYLDKEEVKQLIKELQAVVEYKL